MKKTIVLIGMVCLLFGVAFAVNHDVKAVGIQTKKHDEVQVNSKDKEGFRGFVPTRILVKFDQATMNRIDKKQFKEGKTGIEYFDKISATHGVKSIRAQFQGSSKRKSKIDLSGWHTIEFAKDIDPVAVAEKYKKIHGVITAEPVAMMAPAAKIPNDVTNYCNDSLNCADYTCGYAGTNASQYYIDKIQAPAAWDYTTGDPSIIIAVLDNGVRYWHKDLGGANAAYNSSHTSIAGNMWINTAELNGTANVDDDNNGYFDDWIGWNFISDNANVDDENNDGHGTMCASIMGALTNNGYQMAGICGGWGDGTLQSAGNGCKIMAVKTAGGWQGDVVTDAVANGIKYASDNGAKILSHSYYTYYSQNLADAIDYFLEGGGLIFIAAGNQHAEINRTANETSSSFFMCNYISTNTSVPEEDRDNTICVTMTDQNDNLVTSYSNYGNVIDVAAPGWQFFKLTVGTDPNVDYCSLGAGGGTSFSAPVAAGVAALIWSKNPTWTATQVKQRLYNSCDNIDGINPSYAGKLGHGRVNAYRAVAELDGDGIIDSEDNCPDKPNGPTLGTCTPSPDKAGATCTSDADCAISCSTNGICRMEQEDTDADGIGDVCDNCNDLTGVGVTTTYYRDADNDSYGNASVAIQACTAPAGFVTNSTDCNDSNAAAKPGATEMCNGMDDDCDGVIDNGLVLHMYFRDADNDTYGNAASTTVACAAPDGYVDNRTADNVTIAFDCNERDAAVHPGATEVCNGKDDDCDGQTDYEGCDNDTTICILKVVPERIFKLLAFLNPFIPFVISAQSDSGVVFARPFEIDWGTEAINDILRIRIGKRIIFGFLFARPLQLETGDFEFLVTYGDNQTEECGTIEVQ